MIGIIDYGAGNLKSVSNALAAVGVSSALVASGGETRRCSGLILPGVGAFGAAMERLSASGLPPVLRSWAAQGKPLLGICLGLQLMFEESEESPGVKGLGLFKGVLRRIPAHDRKVPQIGWNALRLIKTEGILQGVPQGAFAYFVHSYYLPADAGAPLAAVTDYGVEIGAAVERGALCACQFHPEKSGETGLQILRRFAQLCGEGCAC